jgi:ABC-type transporter lipoprotein component MlaA
MSFNNDETDIVSSELQGVQQIVLRYENEIKNLKQDIEQLRGENKEVNEVEKFSKILHRINSRIDDLSYEPLDKDDFESIFNQLDYIDTKLDKMEKNYEIKVNEIKDRFELVSKRKIQQLEQKLNLMKPADPEIRLHILETDLKRIEEVINNRSPKIWNFYSMTRFVIVGVLGMIGLLMYEPFWSAYKQLLRFLGLI